MIATPVAVLGAGSWGTALAVLLARRGIATTLWGRTPQIVVDMATARCNARYLPALPFPDALALSGVLEPVVRDAGLVLVAVPSHAFAALLADIAPWLAPETGIAWATKGFDPASGRLLHELVAERLPDHRAAVLTGPSFAREVAAGLPSAITVHSANADFAHALAELLHTPRFRAYAGTDVIGAELGGAMKNVLAVAVGVSDGMELGLNARAGLITRGLAEMMRLGAALGARPETLMGLAGLGDLVLTTTGDLSRNRRLGLYLGRGEPLSRAVADIGQVVESLQTVDTVMQLAAGHDVELPISALVQRVLHEEITPDQAMRLLLGRERRAEFPQD
jgi:glycerol-3-phosphate dehydrogenase (NAD(P)+)